MPKRKRFDWLLQEFVPRKPYKGGALDSPAWSPIDFYRKRGLWAHQVLGPKLDALLDHYGIDRNYDEATKWFVLAVQLVLEHVPRLVPEDRGGRKRSSSSEAMDRDLYLAVTDITLNKKTSISNAIRWLTKTDLRFKGMNPGVLRDRYYDAKYRLAK